GCGSAMRKPYATDLFVSWPRAAMPMSAGGARPVPGGSADPREKLAIGPFEDPAASDGGAHHHQAGVFGGDAADAHGSSPSRVFAHGGEDGPRRLRRHHRHELALVGDVQHIESEDLARAPHLLAH